MTFPPTFKHTKFVDKIAISTHAYISFEKKNIKMNINDLSNEFIFAKV